MRDAPDTLQALRQKVKELEDEVLDPTTGPTTTDLLKRQRHVLNRVIAFIENKHVVTLDLSI